MIFGSPLDLPGKCTYLYRHSYLTKEMRWLLHSFAASASGKDFIWQRHTTQIEGSNERPNNLEAKVSSNSGETEKGAERDNRSRMRGMIGPPAHLASSYAQGHCGCEISDIVLRISPADKISQKGCVIPALGHLQTQFHRTSYRQICSAEYIIARLDFRVELMFWQGSPWFGSIYLMLRTEGCLSVKRHDAARSITGDVSLFDDK